MGRADRLRRASVRGLGGHAVVPVVAAGLIAAAGAGGAAAAAGPNLSADGEQVVFRIRSPQITESSSLVVSTTHEGLAYTTNDSGDAAVVYVVDTTSGAVVGRTTLAGVDAFDIEALGGGADGSLVVADIGDNTQSRDRVVVYRIEQPGRGNRTATPDALSLRYVDGPRDAESVLYDADSGRVFVVSKEFGSAHVYRTRKDAFTRPVGVLRPVAAAPPLATDASYLPGGDLVVVRGYLDATVLRASGWRRLTSFDLPVQEQGESIAAPAEGEVVWVGSEGERSAVLAVPLPSMPSPASPTTSAGGSSTTAQPGPSGTGATQPDTASLDVDAARSVAGWVLGGAAVALGGTLALLAVRSRRSRRS